MVNLCRLTEQFDRGASQQYISPPSASRTGHGSRAKGGWRSDSSHQSFSIGHIFVPSRLCLRELRPEKAVLSAMPNVFRAASGLKRSTTVAFQCTPAFSDSFHLPVRSNQSPLKSRNPVTIPINHSPWILTQLGLVSLYLTLTPPSVA